MSTNIKQLIDELCPNGVEWKTLGEVCEKIIAGGDVPKNHSKGQKLPSEDYPYPIYSNGTGENSLYGFSDSYKIDKKSITISARGTIGYHTVRQPKFTPIIRLITLIPNSEIIIPEFLNYVLDIIVITHSGGSIPQFTVPIVKQIRIPIPPMEEQERIVAILDKFDALVNDISQGLPAEIQSRKEQYEYYRNKLLTFKEKDS
jgi:type I restriction enzyme S subunit